LRSVDISPPRFAFFFTAIPQPGFAGMSEKDDGRAQQHDRLGLLTVASFEVTRLPSRGCP
jgi:hypothetical protein